MHITETTPFAGEAATASVLSTLSARWRSAKPLIAIGIAVVVNLAWLVFLGYVIFELI